MARQVPVADKAIANAALTVLLMDGAEVAIGDPNPEASVLLANYLVESAAKVKFQPSNRTLVLTFDLSMGEPAETPTD
jgi:hypothetical protein